MAKSKAVYLAALAPLGNALMAEGEGWALIGRKGAGRLWIGQFGPAGSPIHIAWRAETRAQVHDFRKAALAAGGRDNGAPGPRVQYAPDYYAAFVIDPDGDNVEAVTFAAA